MTTMQAYDIAGSEWLTDLVAGVTAHVDGPYELTAGRLGSWESARIIEWMQSAGCEIPEEVEYLRAHWAPALPGGDGPRPQSIE